jgi:hypothetical protein
MIANEADQSISRINLITHANPDFISFRGVIVKRTTFANVLFSDPDTCDPTRLSTFEKSIVNPDETRDLIALHQKSLERLGSPNSVTLSG